MGRQFSKWPNNFPRFLLEYPYYLRWLLCWYRYNCYLSQIWLWLYPHITLYIKTIYIYGIFGVKFKHIKYRSVEYNEVNHLCTLCLWSWWENILYIFLKQLVFSLLQTNHSLVWYFSGWGDNWNMYYTWIQYLYFPTAYHISVYDMTYWNLDYTHLGNIFSA